MRACFLVVLIAIPLLPVSAQQRKPVPHPRPTAECSPLAGQTFSCPKFSFTYKVPFGWVDRTGDMQEATATSQNGAAEKTPAHPGSETLLAVFERPPDAPGETINSAVVIVVESLAGYPGIKTAAGYFGPITEIAEQQGFTVVNPPYPFSVGTKQLVRGDFSRQHGKLEMRQATLTMIDKGNVVSFTFIGGSQDEVEDLIGNLSFVRRAGSAIAR